MRYRYVLFQGSPLDIVYSINDLSSINGLCDWTEWTERRGKDSDNNYPKDNTTAAKVGCAQTFWIFCQSNAVVNQRQIHLIILFHCMSEVQISVIKNTQACSITGFILQYIQAFLK